MTAPSIGVDPGSRDGACVLLSSDGRTVLDWLCWWTLPATKTLPVRPHTALPEELYYEPPHERGTIFADQYWPYYLAVEGLFTHRGGRASPASVIPLAEDAGRWLQVFTFDDQPAHRPLANDWRRRQLGLKRGTKKRAAEDYAIQMARTAFDWTHPIEHLTKVARGALSEAAFLARDEQTTRHLREP